MIDSAKVQFRPTVAEDKKPLVRWLMEPGILRWFPMINEYEVEDAAKIWVNYRAIGSCITCLYDGIPCGIANLYVQPFQKLKHQCLFAIIISGNFRGKGIGTLLLQELQKLAKEKFHINLLHLEVYDGNPAIKLYQRNGFTIYGRHERFLKEADGYRDKLLMQKYL